jgi:single-strand DNA-binding protein
MNRVILVGNLTRDIEVRYGQTGLAIGKTGIATNRRMKTQSGEQRDEVMFIDLTFFGRTAEIAQQYFRKGSKILVEGRLVLDQWVDQGGMKRSKHSVTVENLEFIEPKGGSNGQGGGYNNQGGYQQQGGYNNNNNYQQNSNQYGNQQQPSGNYRDGNSDDYSGGYNQQPQQGRNTQQPAPEPSNSGKPSNDEIPEIDIDDMDDQVPF